MFDIDLKSRQPSVIRRLVVRKFAKPPLIQVAVLVGMVYALEWIASACIQEDDGLLVMNLLIGVFGGAFLIILIIRYCSELFLAQKKLNRKEVPCVWCGYSLIADDWPSHCPECGNPCSTAEALKRWSTMADMTFLVSQLKGRI